MKTCGYCRMGNLSKKHIIYANWHGGQFVVAPNVPAWMCDVCGDYEIDSEMMNRLLPLLGPVTRPDPDQSKRHHRPIDLFRGDMDSDRDRRRA